MSGDDTDDELGRFLRSEVPDPAPGFWEEMQARLDGIEAERGGQESAPPSLQIVREEISDEMQTDAEVVRLTDMLTTQDSPARPRYLFAAAAAAFILIAAVGGVVLFNRSDSATEIDVASPATTAPADTSPSPSSIPPSTAPAPGGEFIVDFDDQVIGSVWAVVGSTALDGLNLPGPDGTVLIEFAAGTRGLVTSGSVATDGVEVWVETVADTNNPGYWLPIDRLERLAPSLAVGEPGPFEVTGDGVNARVSPGLDGAIDRELLPGDQVTSLGWRVELDGFVWLQIRTEDSVTLWMAEEFLTAIDLGDGVSSLSSCWRAGDDIIVFDANDDGSENFTGVAIFNPVIQPFAATPLPGDEGLYRVAKASIGSNEDGDLLVDEVIWILGTDASLETSDGAGYELIPCADVAAEIEGPLNLVGAFRPDAPTS